MPTFFDELSNKTIGEIKDINTDFIKQLDDGFELLEIIYDKQANVEDFVFLEVNSAYERQTGIKAADIIGRRKKTVAPASEQRWYDYVIEAVKSGKVLSYQYYNPKVNGFFDTKFIPIPPNKIVVLFKDITERRKAEYALTQTKKNIERIIQQSPVAFALFNKDGLLVEVNDAWVKQWQIPSDAVVGKYNVLESKQVTDIGLIDNLKRVYAGEVVNSFVLEFDASLEPITSGVGRKRWLRVTAYPIKNESGEVTVVVMTEDISEQKNLEKKLQETERLAMIGQTAGMVGHDIRNPLQAMIGDIYLMKEQITSDCKCKNKADITESLVSIDENIDYINKIVQDLQDYARPVTPEYSSADLSNVLVKVLENIRVSESIKLSIKVQDLEKLRIDATLLQRALSNLIINAIQAMPEGGVLEITGRPKENKALITVSDTGVGIPEEVKPKLFTPMMTTKAKGQGFGLAVSKRLIEAMNGTVTFESELGKGTTFIIELPISQ